MQKISIVTYFNDYFSTIIKFYTFSFFNFDPRGNANVAFERSLSYPSINQAINHTRRGLIVINKGDALYWAGWLIYLSINQSSDQSFNKVYPAVTLWDRQRRCAALSAFSISSTTLFCAAASRRWSTWIRPKVSFTLDKKLINH